jgi:hypothetical protein
VTRYTHDQSAYLAGAWDTRPDAFASLPVRLSCVVREVAGDSGARLALVLDATLADYASAILEAARD